MKISRLYTFVRLAKLKSFSKVAEELELTQPAVSLQVKSLEEYFGVELVDRTSDGIILTHEGEVVYKDIKKILQTWDNLSQKINQMQDLVKGELLLGTSTIPGEYLLPDLIAGFCQDYSLVELKVEVKDSKAAIQEVLNKKFDVGIVGFQPNEKDLVSIPVAADNLVVVVPVDHPLAEKNIISKEDIQNERFIIREEGSGTRKAMLAGIKTLGIDSEDLSVAVQLGSTESVLAAVESGIGISIVSSLAARRAAKLNRVKIVQLTGFDVQRQFYLIHHQDAEGNILISNFIDFIKNRVTTN